MSSSLIIISAALGIIYLFVLYFGVGRLLQPLARKVLITLTIVELCLVFLHLNIYVSELTGFSEWFFNVGSEFALGALFSASQLLAVGLIAFVIARYVGYFTRIQRLYWVMLGVLFTVLNLDEYYVLHDSIDEKIFAVLAAIGMAVILGGYWINFRHERKLFLLLFGGLFVMGSALVSDAILPNTPPQSALEEFMEMNGVTLVLVGFLSFAQEKLKNTEYRHAKRIPLIVSTLWFVFLIIMFWVVPIIEHRLFAQPIRVEYLDGDLALVGYRLDQNQAEPGDTIDLTLYWKVDRPVPDKMGVSAHLLTHPDVASVSQSDHLLVIYYQTDAWIPGTITRLPAKLQIPQDTQTPLSYWLQLTVWAVEGYSPTDVVAYDDGWLLDSESLILRGFPVLSNENLLDDDLVDAAYQFGDEFTLSAYGIPETLDSDDPMTLSFEWQTHSQDVDVQYTQFIHVFDGGEFIVGIDVQPFDGRFPTSDWPANAQFTDTIDMSLPDDLPAGNYDVFTGMYDATSQQRLDVKDDGTNLLNGLVQLGTVNVSSDSEASR